MIQAFFMEKGPIL